MKLSGLNYHRMRYHFINFSTCPRCNYPREDEEHYLLCCTAFAALRETMIAQVHPILPQHQNHLNRIEIRANRKIIVKILVHGTKIEDTDIMLFNIVAAYIHATNRFK